MTMERGAAVAWIWLCLVGFGLVGCGGGGGDGPPDDGGTARDGMSSEDGGSARDGMSSEDGGSAGDAGMAFGAPETIRAAASYQEFTEGAHTCAISSSGRLMCWGRNRQGQLGNGTREESEVPVDVSPLPARPIELALGTLHTCALLDDGRVFCWGKNGTGRLGDPSVDDIADEPVEVSGVSAQAVGAGDGHSCAVLTDGSVQCWGDNLQGQLGDGSFRSSAEPVAIDSTLRFADVCGGENYTCALTTDGAVWCWGTNGKGQLGVRTEYLENESPVRVELSPAAEQLSCGSAHGCVVTSDAGISCWGANGHGQLGDGSTTNRLSAVSVVGLPSGASPLQVAAGGGHTCALMDDGQVLCWGANLDRQVADGSLSDRTMPTPRTGLPAAVFVTTGVNWSCALGETGGFCWGQDYEGQLGNGTSDAPEPTTVRFP